MNNLQRVAAVRADLKRGFLKALTALESTWNPGIVTMETGVLREAGVLAHDFQTSGIIPTYHVPAEGLFINMSCGPDGGAPYLVQIHLAVGTPPTALPVTPPTRNAVIWRIQQSFAKHIPDLLPPRGDVQVEYYNDPPSEEEIAAGVVDLTGGGE